MFGRIVSGSMPGHFDDSEREEMETRREERFILNLTRMAGDTNAVFPEHFMEFCVHLTNEAVKELVDIESGYTAVVFNDEEFDFPSCSMEVSYFGCISVPLAHSYFSLQTVFYQEVRKGQGAE